MKAKEKETILDFINGKITENQKEMAAANAAGDNKVYFTSVGVRLAFETLREYINDLREIAEAIHEDNNRKDYCLKLLEKMVYGIDIEPVELEALYNEKGAIWGVLVHFASGGTVSVNVEGDSPLAMVREIIEKAELG